ncbi:STAS/SEC14 domain-containing protein [Nocardioides antri]|uniref:STAS/SEC14 domain-containing protein n=1 Tax=Nocardioides antri TaxID=2607659 RepID=A0A5B1LTH9_9ACTN|nr:STAS/SEC14 domain-containing protein [Nocardioides antri]KAA1424185.1 STAS/SEC14 domain-containing protein [Nocardioides antri]
MSEAVKCYRVTWDEEERIARTEWLPGAVCRLEEAQAVTDAIRDMGHGAVPLYVDMRGMAKLERSAREHFVSDSGGVKAIALVAGSPVTKMMANFFIGMRRMSVPIQMFTDEAAAVTWLQDHR